MPRRKAQPRLMLFLNNRLIGRLSKQPNGAVEFAYDRAWLEWEHVLPVSLSLPLREGRFTGAQVSAVFENLLPDSNAIRSRVAERVGAAGTDAYSLLAVIGRDCAGALQFIPEDDPDGGEDDDPIHGERLSDAEIAGTLARLGAAPLGLGVDQHFRISVAGAQEKTALLRYRGQWMRPHGRTPTTHILKPQIGHINMSAGIVNLSSSVENEYYCLMLLKAFGLDVAKAEIQLFDDRKALVIERFDRHWRSDGRLIRLPQEDLCQALGVPPTRKYQNEGGPDIVAIAELLRGSDAPLEDQLRFFKSQILFWLIGATDGHAKNFSIFLAPGGRFHLTPFYDVLTAQPSLDAHQIRQNAFKLAMGVGDRNRYRIFDIRGRHFLQSARKARLPIPAVRQLLETLREGGKGPFDKVEAMLPKDFPAQIHESVRKSAMARLTLLDPAEPF